MSTRGEKSPGTRAVVRFALSGVAALVLVSVGLMLLLRRSTTDVAIDDAKRITQLVATGIVQPDLDDQILNGDAAALAKLDRAVKTRVHDPAIVRVKVWTSDGRIVYSDEPRLIGRTFTLSNEQKISLRSGAAAADLSDLEEDENQFEKGYGSLLEVYLPVRTPSGRRLLFETYQRFSSIAAGGRKLWLAVLPLTLGALALLEFVQVPAALAMARRLREGQREREELLRRTLDVSNLERRRIASELHDGIVQELAGIGYALSAATDALGEESSADLRQTLADAARRTRQGIRGLRAMVVEIYPPNLRDAGFAAAVNDLAGPPAARGIDCAIQIDDDTPIGEDAEAVLFRVAQEALRNVAAHSGAATVTVTLDLDGDDAVLRIRDDGKGFGPERLAQAAEQGHLGLRLLRDLLTQEGGRLTIEPSGAGTMVEARVPRKEPVT